MSKLTPERISQLLKTFQQFDEDGDGTLSPKEMIAASRLLGIQATEDQMMKKIASVDHNGDGVVNLIEFTELMGHAEEMEGYRHFFKVQPPPPPLLLLLLLSHSF